MEEDEKKRKKKNRKKFEKKGIKRLVEPLGMRIPRSGGGKKPSHVLRHNFNFKPEPEPKPRQEKISWNKAEPWTEPSLKSQPKVVKQEVDIEKMLKQLEKHFDEVLLEKLLKAEEEEFKKLEAELGIKTELEDADKELGLEPLNENSDEPVDGEADKNIENQKAGELKNLENSKTETESSDEVGAVEEASDVDVTRDDYLELEADSLRSWLADDEMAVESNAAQDIEQLPDVESVETPALEDYGAVEIEPELMEPVEVMPEIEPVPELAPEIEAKRVQDAEVGNG
jgi:hypothetical protein